MESCELNSYDAGLKSVAGSCEQSNEAWGSMKGGIFLEQLKLVSLATQES
jgi:hypothetical protein